MGQRLNAPLWEHPLGDRDTGSTHQPVHRAECLHCCVDGSLHINIARDVRFDEPRPIAQASRRGAAL